MPAKKGNKNAQKHGIYAKFIAVVEDYQDIEGMPTKSGESELYLARARLANALKERDAATDQADKIQWDYACRHWIEIVDGMIARREEKRQTELAVFDTLLDAMRAMNDKQEVKR